MAGRPAAIEHRDGVVAQPAEHPPQPRRDASAKVVVGHHLHACIDAPGRERLRECLYVGQRVAAGDAGDDEAGEVVVEMGIDRAGEVRLPVGATASLRVGQREAAIDDGPVGVVEVGAQVGRGQEGGVGHWCLKVRVLWCLRFFTE